MYAHECALSEKKKKEKKDSHFLSLWKIAERIEHHQWKIVECVTSYTLDGKLQ